MIFCALTVIEKSKKRNVVAEIPLDTFKVTYSFWKDVLAIAVGITIADVFAFVVKAAIFFLFIRH